MASHHIPLTIDGRRVLVPAAATLFEQVDSHVVVHFGGEVFNAAETYEQVVAALGAPSVQELCGTLIKASTEAVNSLQFVLEHRRTMPAREVATMLTGTIGTLSGALKQAEAR